MKTPPLHVSIPLALLGIGALFGLLAAFREVRGASGRIEEEARRDMAFVGNQTAGLVQYMLERSLTQGAEMALASVGSNPNLTTAAVANQANEVIFATRYELRHVALQREFSAEVISALAHARRKMGAEFVVMRGGRALVGVFPFLMPAARGSLRSAGAGALLLEYDLASRRDQVLLRALQTSGLIVAGLTALACLLWLFFHLTLMRDVSVLTSTVDQLSQGKLDARTKLDGSSELGVIGVAIDRMAQGLEEASREREQTAITLQKSREQLQLAQKMDAVGRLAGGIAHDFNNLLTVINGSADLLMEDLSPTGEQHALAEEILRAGVSAAKLTGQLLAFSRKQLVTPKVLDLRESLGELVRMLARLVGENIELETDLHAEAGCVLLDSGQLEQVVVNLVVNARDAMPEGGKLSIRTRRESPTTAAASALSAPLGWVMLAVRDTGVGMDEATRARIFEPFFSTKAPGHGTGVGLATVYGIVSQAGGVIEVESAPRRGSEFRVYLPRTESEASAPGSGYVRRSEPRATLTILVVEDMPAVRNFAVQTLSSAGHRVLSAADGPAALALVEPDEPIDLVLTDVIMPHMNGAELVAALRRAQPGLRVLYMSGYTADVIEKVRQLEPDVALLNKPFTAQQLLDEVRRVCARAPSGAASQSA